MDGWWILKIQKAILNKSYAVPLVPETRTLRSLIWLLPNQGPFPNLEGMGLRK